MTLHVFPTNRRAITLYERRGVRTPARLVSGDVAPYGLGFRTQERPDGRTVLLHTGSTNGSLATCTFPTEENDTTVILLTTVVGDGFAELRRPSSTSCGATPDICFGRS